MIIAYRHCIALSEIGSIERKIKQVEYDLSNHKDDYMDNNNKYGYHPANLCLITKDFLKRRIDQHKQEINQINLNFEEWAGKVKESFNKLED